MSQIQQEAGVVVEMPKTPEELYTFIAKSFGQLMAIPENATIFANTILHAQLRALQVNSKVEASSQLEMVLARIEYPGCLRAEVTQPDAATGLLDVVLECRDPENKEAWTSDTGFNADQIAAFKRLVLSQTTVPTDVWFITTSAAVNQTNKEVAEMLIDRSGEIQKMADEAEQLAQAQA